TTLTTHPHITQAAVTIHEDPPGNKQLIAYTVNHPDIDTEDIRRHATTHLPPYMIPTTYITLDALPLTINGKLDRKALPTPTTHNSNSNSNSNSNTQGPRNNREETLCRIFATVLGRDTVGIDDSFFDLGGDSITSIQLVSRARKTGLTLTARDIFEHKTVRQLATHTTHTTTPTPTTPNTPATGNLPLLPITHWLHNGGGPITQFNQSYTVTVPPNLQHHHLTTALTTLIHHHDALRTHLTTHPDGTWTLHIPTPDHTPQPHQLLHHIKTTPTNHTHITQETEAARHRLDPENGIMLQAVWFDHGPTTDGRLLLVIHHLAIDGVSWRILLPDLATAHHAATTNTTPQLQPTTTPLRTWAHALTQAATQPHYTNQLPYWNNTLT
ncbi:condensation domain-containing protein, partial [Streptomyces sp. NPDC092296]|uniref:condensation domain-containing protein n=1 Tax=Streptomyces sp. NPDC092296 TaxID=3366012 RepID=UPI00382C2505